MKNKRETYFIKSENKITTKDYLLSLCLMLEEAENAESSIASDLEIAA